MAVAAVGEALLLPLAATVASDGDHQHQGIALLLLFVPLVQVISNWVMEIRRQRIRVTDECVVIMNVMLQDIKATARWRSSSTRPCATKVGDQTEIGERSMTLSAGVGSGCLSGGPGMY